MPILGQPPRSNLQNNDNNSSGYCFADVLVTLLCWGYFIFAFLLFFSFFYMVSYFFAADRERAFQYLNHLFFKGFLALLRVLAPRHRWEIDPRVADIQGSIIVCNHLSYLDPLLFLSLLRRNKTIVKTKFFSAPVFGWLVAASGYLPAGTEGRHGGRMIDQVEKMGSFFREGGNLFVFPEGTRTPEAGVGSLHKGVFKIARMYNCPIEVMRLRGTHRLFTPGRFFFNTRQENRISLQCVETIEPESRAGKFSLTILEEKVRRAFQHQHSYPEGGRV